MTELRRRICELYADHTMPEIAEMLGCHPSTVGRTVRRYNLKHSEATLERISQKWSTNFRKNCMTPEMRQKGTDVTKERRRKDMLREKYGLPRKTNMRFKKVSLPLASAMFNLVDKHGYIRTTDTYTLFYDEHTHRRLPELIGKQCRRYTEEYYTKKYGIKFIADYQNG